MLQIAITFAVVINSISIIEQRISLMNRESGMKEEQLFSFKITAFGQDYNIEQNMRQDLQLLRNTPGIIDAEALNDIPMSGSGSASGVANSRESYDNGSSFSTGVIWGGSHTINTLGVNLIAGRNFTPDEIKFDDGTLIPSAVIITQTLADQLYPDGGALGKKIFRGSYDVTIVGIIEHMTGFWSDWSGFDKNLIFPSLETQNIIVRAEKNAIPELMGSIEKLLFERNSNRVISQIYSMSEHRARSYGSDSAMTTILWVVIGLLIVIT